MSWPARRWKKSRTARSCSRTSPGSSGDGDGQRQVESMQLPSDQFQELHDAIRDAYTASRLEQMLYTRLGKRLDEVSLDTDFKTVVFKLLRDAEMNGYIPALVVAARQSNPGNDKLQAAAQRFGLSALTSTLEKIVR